MREVVSIHDGWYFCKTEDIPTSLPTTWESVTLPHTWNGDDGQDGGNDYYRGVGCYVKALRRADLPSAEVHFLDIAGANSSAQVYLNGVLIAQHDGGYSRFRVELTPYLKEENVLVIAVDNAPNAYVYPQMADFTFYGGLYRAVSIVGVPHTHIALDHYGDKGLRITPRMEDTAAEVEVAVRVTDFTDTHTVRYVITDAQGKTVAQTTSRDLCVQLHIDNVHRWHGRQSPYLYTATVELCENGEVTDRVSARFGCRRFYIDPDKGFVLNGKPYPLRGVSRHQDRPHIGNALLSSHHKEDMDIVDELGATALRLAHYQHDDEVYDLCDERGIIVWAEIPYISKHMEGGRGNTISQMTELIHQQYNHPCIVVWGLSNEITMAGEDAPDLLDNHRALNEWAHTLDTTRPTTMACLTMCRTDSEIIHIPDTLAYNHYFGWYGGDTSMNGPWFDAFHKQHPHIPIGCSEYGCEALDYHTAHPKQGDYTEEYQALYHEELIKQFFTRPYLWATFVWNLFDFGADARNEGGEAGQNHKGLVTFDRRYKKDAFYAYKAWLSDVPFVHLCGKRYSDRTEDTTTVTVYSNQPTVTLFANGECVATQSAPDHFFRFSVPNIGETVLVATAGNCRDESRIRKVDTENESYRLKETGTVLNWFDITERDGYFSLNDTLGEIVTNAEGQRLFAALAKRMQQSIGQSSGMEMGAEMLQMMNGFTVLRLAGLMSTAGVTFTKEELLALNAQLNQIRKPNA